MQLFLSRAISPPKTAAMENAWSTLEELGAIDQDGNLTALGRHIVRSDYVLLSGHFI
jgi:HrpA-like RNA helicase